MTTKQVEFLNYMFKTLTGSESVAGTLWVDLYPEQCETLLENLDNYYKTFENVFGTPKLNDISQMIFTEIISITPSINVKDIESVSSKYLNYFKENNYCY